MPDTGSLKVSIVSRGTSFPVDNATIRITPRGSQDTLEEMVSNSSGQSDTVLLDAPPIDYSMDPASTTMPYSEYDVTVSAEGYDTTKVEGVQILPETGAVQNVSLTPRNELEKETINIPVQANTLWGVFPPKIPESEVKQLPTSSGLVVLPDPVIPEFIVVHDGVPTNTAAPNYWVPFKDYIKNVASCEIYATWPTETITANVLAILSFTLNRVYTEWYRGKGYNFTITNSTAFDHAFSYGRNIFKEISEIVDNIFNKYVTRPNIMQPLLTQYCDGKRVSCPNWMSQWGSKTLGDQGYYAMDILKNYYGYDVYLMEANQVEGVPSSFPGNDLQRGSSGAPVRTIQMQLNAISDNYPAIPKVRVDGQYGQETVAAVTQFQEIFNMNPTGIVDFPTWYKISDIYVGVTQLAELV